MKKVALITTNKILAQSLAAAIKAVPDCDFEFFIFLDPQQALIDAEIFEIDVALIDGLERDTEGKTTLLSFCESLHKKLADCHLLLLAKLGSYNRLIAGQLPNGLTKARSTCSLP